jgi:hypothetical protein
MKVYMRMSEVPRKLTMVHLNQELEYIANEVQLRNKS